MVKIYHANLYLRQSLIILLQAEYLKSSHNVIVGTVFMSRMTENCTFSQANILLSKHTMLYMNKHDQSSFTIETTIGIQNQGTILKKWQRAETTKTVANVYAAEAA